MCREVHDDLDTLRGSFTPDAEISADAIEEHLRENLQNQRAGCFCFRPVRLMSLGERDTHRALTKAPFRAVATERGLSNWFSRQRRSGFQFELPTDDLTAKFFP